MLAGREVISDFECSFVCLFILGIMSQLADDSFDSSDETYTSEDLTVKTSELFQYSHVSFLVLNFSFFPISYK
jgi:hypothetical protein